MSIAEFYETGTSHSIIFLNIFPAIFAVWRLFILSIQYANGESISSLDDSVMFESKVVFNTKCNHPGGIAIDWALHACAMSAGALVWPVFYVFALVFGVASIFRKKNLERKAILDNLKGTDNVN